MGQSTTSDSRPDIFVGVDGGGSTCRVRVRDAAGVLRGGAEGGPANVSLSFGPALDIIEAALDAALAAAGLDRKASRLRLGLGLAGASSPAMAARVAAALAPWGSVSVTSDADIACIGAHGGQDGGLIIAGTGSGAVARLNGVPLHIGGRGFLLGDDGSGARIGLDALRRALRAQDGLAAHTPLTRTLMTRFDHDPLAAIAWGRAATSRDFAALAPEVVAAAEAGDPAGQLVVAEAVSALAGLADALWRRGVGRLSFVGGLAPALRPFLPTHVRAALASPLADALEGALFLARCRAASAPP